MPKYALLNTVQLAGGKLPAGSTIDSVLEGVQYAQALAAGGQLIVLPNEAIEAAQATALNLQRRGASDAELSAVMIAAQAKEGGSGGGTPPALRIVFTSSGLFSKAPYVALGYTVVEVDVGGSGGGGAGGETGDAGTLRRGGNGGAGGGRSRNRILLADLEDDTFYNVENGGGGGPDGSPGADGSPAFWAYGGPVVYAPGGAGGQSGSKAQALGGPGDIAGLNGAVYGDGAVAVPYEGQPIAFYYPVVDYPGVPVPASIIAGVQYRMASYFGGGGGAGGSIDAADTIQGDGSRGSEGSMSAGGNGGGPAGGVAPGGDGMDGADYQPPTPENYMAGGAGGGGGAARLVGGGGGKGGDASRYGGGGGGGGAATNGEGFGGSGGDGYRGLIILWLS